MSMCKRNIKTCIGIISLNFLIITNLILLEVNLPAYPYMYK